MTEHGGASVLRLSIPARPEYLVLCRLVLTGLSRDRAIDPDTLDDLKLALTEACSNSILHAYKQSVGTVEVRYELGEDYLAVDVLDDGPGFEPPPEDDDREALAEGGFGLRIIRSLSDEIEIGRRPNGRGSCVRFVKQLS